MPRPTLILTSTPAPPATAATSAPYEPDFDLGEPVWVRRPGYPWCPAHVAFRNEYTIPRGTEPPNLARGEFIVIFFNDNKRVAALHERDMRSFLAPYYSNLNVYYEGRYKDAVQGAVREAMKYCSQKGYLMQKDDGRRVAHGEAGRTG